MWVTILQAIDMLTCLPQSLRDPLHNLQLCWTLSHKAHKALNSHTTVSVTTKILIRKAKPKFLKSVWLACEKKASFFSKISTRPGPGVVKYVTGYSSMSARLAE